MSVKRTDTKAAGVKTLLPVLAKAEPPETDLLINAAAGLTLML